MSGQPYVYAKDKAMYRQRYMDVLSLTSNINDMNLQANRTYKQTGQLPPQSVPDNRTTSEILGDIEKMKVTLIATLKPIMDSQMAQSVIQGIQNSPYNADGSLFNFFAQRSKALVEQLSKIYSFGIKGDTNDVAKLIAYIVDAYVKTKAFSKFGKDNINSITGELYSGMSPQFLQQIENRFVLIVNKMRALGFLKTQDLTRVNAIIAKLRAFLRILSGADEIPIDLYNGQTVTINSNPTSLTQTIQALSGQQDSDIDLTALFSVYERYMQLVEEFPKPENFETLLTQLQQSSVNRNDVLFDRVLDNIDSLIPDIRQLDRINREILIAAQEVRDQAQVQAPPQAQQPQLQAPAVIHLGGGGPDYGGYMDELDQYLAEIDVPNAPQEANLHGNGVRRRRGRPRGNGIKIPFANKIDTTVGIDPEPQYIKFGKYVINGKKLSDNIFSLRHRSGANIIGHPNIKISDNMKRILKHIIGGGLPNFEDMSNLTNDERKYLYDVSRKSDIIDKLNIPAPSRDQQNKDNHNFEVMKGEIMSGNDSKELVKNFKLLILKMSKSGDLPKSQVSELLTDLAELGY